MAAMSSMPSSSGVSEVSRYRPSSVVLSSPSSSHSPGTLFPEMNNTYPRVGGRPDFSRRHTTYLATPRPRPLRSSPLAGPSLALGRDGTLKDSDDSHSDTDEDNKQRCKPSRINSSPDVPSTFSSSARSSEDGPASDPKSASSPNLEQSEASEEVPPLPNIPNASRLSRRLSWGLTKLTELPSISRSSSVSSVSSKSSRNDNDIENIPPPPVPEIPVWARPGHVSRSSPSLRSTGSARRSVISPPSATPVRRPTTADSASSATSLNRRSTLVRPASPSVSRNPELNWLTQAAAPKFSRLSLKAEGVVMPVSAKDAKYTNRRSAIYSPPGSPNSLSSKPLPGTPAVPKPVVIDPKGKAREGSIQLVPPSRSVSRASSMASLGSVVSEMSGMSANGTILQPPSFRMNSYGSSSSTVDSSLPTTPNSSLSRTTSVNSTTGKVVDELGMLAPARPRPSYDKDRGLPATVGALRSSSEAPKRRSVVFELRVNDVHVEVMGKTSEPKRSAATSCKTKVLVTECKTAAGSDVTVSEKSSSLTVGTKTLSRGKGTIKRVWKRVMGTVSVRA
ncbi:hypothetical protein QCA50_018976 [Cerrena zonata]|uniref:Uncharacterized protein n=1 Tax=Cerrena zonata TaxID=2478898 RepID=A0AAW0FG19_9APHY